VSADVLREATALMRSRAEAATPGRWDSAPDHGGRETGDGHQVFGNRHRPEGSERDSVQFVGKCWGWGPTEANAQHIASWHPAVALAVADWLSDIATDLDHDLWPDGHDVPRNALAVAVAYLGDPA